MFFLTHLGMEMTISDTTTARCIVMKFCTDIHGPQWLNPPDFDDPLSFPVASPAG